MVTLGNLIVIEGTDTSGKETQSKLLAQFLEENGYKVKHFAFPMYNTPTGKIIGGPYLGKEGECPSYFEEGPKQVDPYISCLYYAADRKYNFDKIKKYLEEDYYVILDRYTTSNMGHQGGKIMDKDERFHMYQWIDKLEYWLLKLPKPDRTIFLHMPPEYSKNLLNSREELDDYEKSKAHLKNAEEAYIELSELYNWDRIECVEDEKLKSIQKIHEEILEKLSFKIKE